MQDIEDKSEKKNKTAGRNGEGWRVETLGRQRKEQRGK